MITRRPIALALLLVLLLTLTQTGTPPGATAQTRPEGEIRWAVYVTLSPQWFDPAEVIGVLTPFWVMYALHDALVKPMPGTLLSPSLAESWTVSRDQRVYEFRLREGLKFHNGDPFTAEDVKFSFERAKGAKQLQASGIGPRVEEPALMLIDPYPWSAPLEEVRLKKR
jgi:peptide/nickel transport system substrate-binding protein